MSQKVVIISPTLPPAGQMAEIQQHKKRHHYCHPLFILLCLTQEVENMVIDSQTNTYTFSSIMHLPYVYMLNYEQLGFHSVVEAGVSHYTVTWQFTV